MQIFRPGFVQVAFGGEGGGGGGGGSDRAPSRSQRPGQRPSIMTVERDGKMQRVATRDMPRFGITAGQTESEPSYSPFSLRALTSKDPANVMRNIQGAERNLAAFPPGGGDDDDRPAPAPAPVTPAAPVETAPEPPPAPPPPAPPVETETGLTPAQEARIEEAGETAAEKQRKLGLAQTIATSPMGLLSTGGTTRRRRSLIGGGLIA